MKHLITALLSSLLLLSNVGHAQNNQEVNMRFSLFIIPGASEEATKDLFYVYNKKRIEIMANPGRQSIAYPYKGNGTINIYRGAMPASDEAAAAPPKPILSVKVPAGKKFGILVASPNGEDFVSQPYWFSGRETGDKVYIRNSSKNPLAAKFLEQDNKEKRPDSKGAVLIKPGAAQAVSTRTSKPSKGNYRIARMHLYALKKDSKGKQKPLHIKRKNLVIKEGEGAAVLLYETGRYQYRTIVLNAKGTNQMFALEKLNKQLGIRKKKTTGEGEDRGEEPEENMNG